MPTEFNEADHPRDEDGKFGSGGHSTPGVPEGFSRKVDASGNDKDVKYYNDENGSYLHKRITPSGREIWQIGKTGDGIRLDQPVGKPGYGLGNVEALIAEIEAKSGIKADNEPGLPDADTLNELDIARMMAAGELTSPQRVINMSLFAIRITGTGTAYRSKDKQFTYRPPEHYLNDEFLARCNGLPVIYEHPAKATLNSEEFAGRVVGGVLLPYIQGDEVWGIAKIYDDNAIEEMSDPEKKMSTSPTVVFRSVTDNAIIELDNGNPILIEGVPSLLDHVAICAYGVWDKGGEPTGVLNNSTGVTEMPMTEEEFKKKSDEFEAKAKCDADEKAGLEKKIADMQAKMDAMEADMPAPAMTAADKAKADAEAEEEKKEEAEKTKADAALRADVAALQRGLNFSDEDRNKIAEAQMKAQGVAMAFGDSAPQPLLGESPLAYRKRLVGKFKEHSASWKAVPLEAISDAVIDLAERQVYADAAVAARNPASVPDGGLREIKRMSPGGHQISEFVGSISAFTGAFKPPVRRFVTQINKDTRH